MKSHTKLERYIRKQIDMMIGDCWLITSKEFKTISDLNK